MSAWHWQSGPRIKFCIGVPTYTHERPPSPGRNDSATKPRQLGATGASSNLSQAPLLIGLRPHGPYTATMTAGAKKIRGAALIRVRDGVNKRRGPCQPLIGVRDRANTRRGCWSGLGAAARKPRLMSKGPSGHDMVKASFTGAVSVIALWRLVLYDLPNRSKSISFIRKDPACPSAGACHCTRRSCKCQGSILYAHVV